MPVLRCPKKRLKELEYAIGLQPLPVHLIEVLEFWALHALPVVG